MLRFLLVVALVAIAVYLLVRLSQRRAAGGSGGGSAPLPPPKRPIGPDDDPDFLWNLDRRKRHPQKPEAPEPRDEPTDEAPEGPTDEPVTDDDDTKDRRTGES